jgi:ribosomal protein S3AE
MAKQMKHKLKVRKKGVKKKFYDVKAPVTATKIQLYGAGVEDLDGRVVKLDLTRSLRGKSFELKLRVKAEGEELVGEPESLVLMGSYVRRAMRKGVDYVEDSFDAECRDVVVKIKPFLIARNRISRAVRKALRDLAKKTLEGYLKNRTAKEIFSEIMTNKLQKQLSSKLRKIYPLALCEIRVFKIERGKEKEKKAEKVEEVEE